MDEWEQETFIEPEPESTLPEEEQKHNRDLLLDTRLLHDLALMYATGVGTNRVEVCARALDRAKELYQGNEIAFFESIATPLPNSEAKGVEFIALEKGARLASFLYMKELLRSHTHAEAIHEAEKKAITICKEYEDSFLPIFVGTHLLEIKRRAESGPVDPDNKYVETFTKKTGVSNRNIIRTRAPSTLIFPTDKVSNKVFSGEIPVGAGTRNLAMEKKGSKKEINTVVQIDYENLPGVTLTLQGGLTEYDRAVHNAIVAQHLAGNSVFSPQMVYQAMTGDTEARLSETQAEAIKNSINKLMICRVDIDAKEEAEQRGWSRAKYEGRMIAWDKLTVSLNGNEVECYRLLRAPVLYEYASQKGQIARADIKLLKSPLNKNEETLVLQNYLLRRIFAMQGSDRMANSIRYESVYEHLSVEGASPTAIRMKKTQIRGKVKTILDFWADSEFIKGWTETKKSTKDHAISIILSADSKPSSPRH